MGRFNADNFYPDLGGGGQDIWSSPAKNMRFNVPSDKTVVIDAEWESNLPGMAEEFLGDMDLFWVLLVYNGLTDPIEDIVPGTKLRIPRRREMIAYLEREVSYTERTVRI